MTTQYTTPGYGTVDLTNCDREPIHIPGAIQPHGALLGVREQGLMIMQASANATSMLGVRAEAGTSLTDVFGIAACDDIRGLIADGSIFENARAHRVIRPVTTDGSGPWDIVLHRSGGLIIIEIEPRIDADELTPTGFRDVIQRTLTSIEHADSLRTVAQQIAEQMRELTDFDRVWVYKFHEDWHGEIIGESMADGIESWLGLHYPASDIPVQARALFLRNWLRMIPDIAFTPSPLAPQKNPLNDEPLDLGGATLRSASPIHLQDLTNMGVRASLVISLIHRGKLWGLISGHHYSGPKVVGFNMRTICEFLAHALSFQVGLADAVEDRDHILRLRDAESGLRARLGETDSFSDALLNGEPNLMDIACATGAAVCYRGECTTVGKTPNAEQVTALIDWLREHSDDVFILDALSTKYPPAAEFSTEASGLIAIRISTRRNDYLLWFREERKQTIPWAGDPNKPVVVGQHGEYRLSPRGSFALWEEERVGTSSPWHPAEIRTALDLRGTLLDLLLRNSEELERLNMELSVLNTKLEVQTEELHLQEAMRKDLLERETAARASAEKANRAKGAFLAVMSHELRTPLNAIGGYVQLMQMGIRGPITPQQNEDFDRIQRSQAHLLGLINSILNFAKLESGQIAFHVEDVDLAAVVDEVIGLVSPQMELRNIAFEHTPSREAIAIHADAEKVRQILLNLLSNAIKFTADSGTISLRIETTEDRAMISVRDTGRGIPADRLRTVFEPFVQVDGHVPGSRDSGVGLGLAISRDLALRMDGDLTAQSEVGKGSTFVVTLPRSATRLTPSAPTEYPSV